MINKKESKFISEKWEQVFKAIPDDGSPTRFKEIVEKLPKFSRSTISAALTYFSHTGLIKKEEKSKKTVLYSKITIEQKLHSIQMIEKFYPQMGMDKIEILSSQLLSIPPSYYKKMLLSQKGKATSNFEFDESMVLQTCILNNYLIRLDIVIGGMLWDYANEPDKKKRDEVFNNEIQLFIRPLLKELPPIIEDGMDIKVYSLLSFKERSPLKENDFEMVEEAFKDRKN